MLATLTDNALAVLRARYLAREDRVVVETPDQLFSRVARHISEAEAAMGATPDEIARARATFERMMSSLEFLPNSPTLMNAGRPLGQLAACFVVPVDDSTTGVFEAVRWAAEIQKTGGGTGFSFSRLRPAGDRVASTGGTASGPVALMQVFNVATEAIKQGGTRRGANMGMLRVDHPDILDFIAIKLDPSRMRNFNLSVAVTDAFMAAARSGAPGASYDLVNPRTGQVAGTLEARRVLDAIANAAWACGDPGLVFIDRVNDAQPTPDLGAIEATNPCVTGDTRIWVESRGLVPIADLVGTTPRVATLDGDRVVFRRATLVAPTGVRPICRLTAVEGLELRLTADHRVWTERGDTPAGDLQRGDRVRLMVGDPPRVVDRESGDARMGELVGWLTGEGHFTHQAGGKPAAVLAFHGRDRVQAAPRVLDTARTLLGDRSLDLSRSDALDLASLRSQRLFHALRERGVEARCKREIPETIWRGNDAMVAGYLRGLLSASGTVHGSSARGVSLAGNELGILRGAQQLLLRLGIRSVLHEHRRSETTRILPDAAGALHEHRCVAQHELVITRASLRVFGDVVGFMVQGKADQLRALLEASAGGPSKEGGWVTVSEVVLEGEAEVFDLTEPTTSHFFAGGLLVHNCGEQPLLPFESCTLGSIDLGRFVVTGELDWARLGATIHDAVRFLDDVIEANHYPLIEIERATKATRKIGLGVMGWADALVALGIPYDAPGALALAGQVAAFLERESLAASVALAERRGPFPAWRGSRWERAGHRPLRNATTTTIAPTGTISIIAGCASGIEPLYALAYRRNVLDGAELVEINPQFRRLAAERGFASDALFAAVALHGGVRGRSDVPDDVQRVFPTAHEIDVEAHVRMQAAFQRHVHAAVSKTINLHREATPLDVKAAYQLAYELGCKGITVYRDGSREGQVLVTGAPSAAVAVAPSCPECGAVLIVQSGCRLCRHCGWSVCG
ncbi:MAG TPA: ribonucleotide reductase N-terminal alpha domain-containing protein [Kofleriaceae bacterium]|nr:ribonucleotide reductase N-terminal alpha domain-containing protein [Kofleriaceae bacterium]